MAHTKKHSAPVPPGNQAQSGPPDASDQAAQQGEQAAGEGASFQEQDPKRRLGDFTGAGEHSHQQPGGRNDADH
jgi:hypothetical protein